MWAPSLCSLLLVPSDEERQELGCVAEFDDEAEPEPKPKPIPIPMPKPKPRPGKLTIIYYYCVRYIIML